MASYTKKIALNTMVQVLGRVITTAISVVMLAYLARYLGVGGYGDYTTIFAFIQFFAIIADMGFYTVSVREMAKYPERSKEIIGNIFSLRIIFAFVFLLLAPAIGSLIPAYGPEIKAGFWIASFSSLFILLNQLFASIFQVRYRMDLFTIGDIIGRIFLFLVVMAFIYLKFPLSYFIFANVICNFVAFVFYFISSRKLLKFSLKFDTKYFKYLLREAIPLGIIIMLVLVYFKIDTIMLSIMKDSRAVGIYGAPYKILEILITIPAIFMGSVFPLISKYLKEKDDRFGESFKTSFDFISILSIPILIGTLILARPIIMLVLGPEFLDSVIALQLLIFAVFIIFYGTIFGNFAAAAHLQRKLVWAYLVSVLINIVGNFILIPQYSYVGSSIATIFTELFVASTVYLILLKNLRLVPRLKVFSKSVLAGAVMATFLYIMRDCNIFILIVVGSVVYFGVLYIVGGINKSMLSKVVK